MRLLIIFVAVYISLCMQHDCAVSLPIHRVVGPADTATPGDGVGPLPPGRSARMVTPGSNGGGTGTGNNETPGAGGGTGDGGGGNGDETDDEEDDPEPSSAPNGRDLIGPVVPHGGCGSSMGRAKCVNTRTYYSTCRGTCQYWVNNDRNALRYINWNRLNDGTQCGPNLGTVNCRASAYYDLCKSTCNHWLLLGLV